MRLFSKHTVFLVFLSASPLWAGQGIATSTFTLPNNTGQSVNDLHVVTTGPTTGLTVNSATFGPGTVGGSNQTFDFAGPLLGNGSSDTLTASTGVNTDADFVGILDYYWTQDGTQVGSTYYPLEPTYNPPFLLGYTVQLSNNTSSAESYTNANASIDGTQVLTNGSGTVNANSNSTLVSGPYVDNVVNLSFTDTGSGALENLTFTYTPEPRTLALTGLILMGGFLASRRLRRARA